MSSRVDRKKTELIVIHHSGSFASRDIGAFEIDQLHRARGFDCIGYHLVIRRDGRVESGRALSTVGAHARGFNTVSVGLCLVGGRADGEEYKAELNFTPKQWLSLAQTLSALLQRYPNAVIVGHNDLSMQKDCPGFNVRRTFAVMLREYPEVLLHSQCNRTYGFGKRRKFQMLS